MNRYFYKKDARDFFQDEKLVNFLWNRAERYLRSSKKFKRDKLFAERHKNIVYLEKHFIQHASTPTTPKYNQRIAQAYLDVIMPRMDEFKKYIGELKLWKK